VSRARIDWRWVIAAILAVILFVPMRRYVFPVNLPFEVEPYRILVAFVFLLWALSLLAQRDVAIRRSGLDGPMLLFAFSLVASDFANPARMAEYQSFVLRGLTLALSVVVFFYFVVSVVRTYSQVLTIVKLLVAGNTLLAVLALIETRTGWSLFDHVHQFFPLLVEAGSVTDDTRLGDIRALGSAEHPIAQGALFALAAPLALYLAVRFGRGWWVSLVIILGGTVATVSRTAAIMLLVASLVMLALRFRETWCFAPLLIPMVVMIHFAAPGTLGALKYSFTPSGGLIAEQSNEHGRGSGRIADVGPSLDLFKEKPVFGYGYGTLQTSGPEANARILDNQWLSSLLNIGLVGVFSLVWLLARFLRGMTRSAQRLRTPDGWLLVALGASAAAFTISMFTFDAFTFTQVLFVFFMLLGLGSVLVFVEDPILAPRSEPAGVANTRRGAARQRQPALSSE
jgi:polysaccharide biosynthesis protein PslJ